MSCCVVPRCCVGCFVSFVVFCGFFCAVLCWCAGIVLCGVLSCCVVGFVAGGLPSALVPPFCLVLCGPLLCRAVLCGVSACVVSSSVVVWCVVLCVVLVCGVVWSSGLLRCVGLSCLPPPPLLLPLLSGLLLLPGPLSRPVVVFCPGVQCCVVVFCCLSCGVLLSASFLAGGALLRRSRWLVLCVDACCCSVFVAESGCPLLFLLACFLAGAPAWPRGLLPCFSWGLLWRTAPLCCILCPVVLCCRVVLCCGALLSVLIFWWCWFVSFPCVCGDVLCCNGAPASCYLVPV